ncbi:hypothetical protein OAO18_07050 [Francisellaceae bacterium]|nr:hypothetical protein [Francisellaceae bacterium]
MSNLKQFSLTLVTTLLLLGSTNSIADDIYVVPKSDNPVDNEKYNEQLNLKANDTSSSIHTQPLPPSSWTEDPYTSRNVSPDSVRSNIIQNNFVDVTVLKASPGNIANDTEDLLTGRESNIVNAPDSKTGQSGISINDKGAADQ